MNLNYEEVKDLALGLSMEERLKLCTALSKTFTGRGRKPVEERAREMELAMIAAGFSLAGPTRSRANTATRAIIAHALAVEGYTEYAIASILQRDHSTVHHMKKTVENALAYPKQYPDVVGQYKSFTANLFSYNGRA